MIDANTIVGARYRVVRALGGGGMKLVYLAEDLRLAARRCALAEMVDSFTSGEAQRQAIAAFRREAEMLAQLSNEHIPRVFDRFSEANRHYLVMEYIDGTTLEDELRKNGGKLSPARVVDIAVQVLDTLEYLHNLLPPVIYRDLKPSNVMITADGLAKLIDFGIARHFQPLTNATMIGTQGYAPPEQYRGRVETRSDLYALGATMHHALSGRDPAAEAPFSFPPLHKLCPDIDGRLAAVIDQALAYDVINRVTDASAFKRRLLEATTQAPDAFGATGTGLSSAVKPQLRLPRNGPSATPAVNPAAASAQATASARQRSSGSTPVNGPSAPTVLSLANEIKCPGCARPIPADSRFCSYCATDLRFPANVGASASASPNVETVVLSAPHPSHARDDMRPVRTGIGHRRTRNVDRHRRRHRMLVLAVIFLGSFIAMKIHRAISENAAPSGYTSGSSEPSGFIPPVPSGDEGGIAGTPRLAAFRQALDARGYTNVQFRMEGDTIILWGSVPTDSDHAMVQMLCARAGISSLRDNLTVNDTDMGG